MLFFLQPAFYHCPLCHDIITLSYKIDWPLWPNDVLYVSVTYHRCPLHKQRLTGIMNFRRALVFTTIFLWGMQLLLYVPNFKLLHLRVIKSHCLVCMKLLIHVLNHVISFAGSVLNIYWLQDVSDNINNCILSGKKNVFWLKFLFVAELCNWQDVCQLTIGWSLLLTHWKYCSLALSQQIDNNTCVYNH